MSPVLVDKQSGTIPTHATIIDGHDGRPGQGFSCPLASLELWGYNDTGGQVYADVRPQGQDAAGGGYDPD